MRPASGQVHLGHSVSKKLLNGHFPFAFPLPAAQPPRPAITRNRLRPWKVVYNGPMFSPILIVDDDQEVCLSLSEVLHGKGFSVRQSSNPEEVLPLLEREHIGLIIMDVRMPTIGGIDLLKLVRRRFDDLPVIMISGYASVENAVRAMKYGALNFYTKPIPITALLQEIQNLELSEEIGRNSGPRDSIITKDAHMQKILSLVAKAAPTEASVILTGESGTGKELVADLMHESSGRPRNAYVKINCAAVPENLLESEMFGHEKGAYTDARTQQKGKIEIADGGTLFLDEIGDMSLPMQAKMLRVLQDRQFTRVGGTEPIHADFRIIAATNRDLTEMIKRGTFREDLYYRISVITIHLPPLRDRREDIVPIANAFVRRFNQVYGKNHRGFSDDVVEVLERHSWPGNVRELKNIVERAVIFCESEEISLNDLPEQYHIVEQQAGNAAGSLQDLAAASSRAVIEEALKRSNGVKGEAARRLNITRKTLYNRMKKLNIQ